MKQPNKTELKKIANNCRKATFLIEKQQISKLTARERLELQLHLAGCSICVTFMQQSMAINQMARKLFHSGQNQLKLDDIFKKQLQKHIDTRLDKK